MFYASNVLGKKVRRRSVFRVVDGCAPGAAACVWARLPPD
jgi:hypothetical protein